MRAAAASFAAAEGGLCMSRYACEREPKPYFCAILFGMTDCGRHTFRAEATVSRMTLWVRDPLSG